MGPTQSVQHRQLCQAGEHLAEKLGLEVSQVRYARYVLHDGRQWTDKARWERLEDGR